MTVHSAACKLRISSRYTRFRCHRDNY